MLRVGPLGDSELLSRRLGELRMCNVASPAYIAAHGMPRTLADLAQHRVVHYSGALSVQGAGFEYRDPDSGAWRTHPVRSVVTVNGTDAYQAACLAGLGIIQAPVSGAGHLVEAGRLVEVLPELRAAPLPVSLLYASRRQLPPRVQAAMGWIAQVLQPYLARSDDLR